MNMIVAPHRFAVAGGGSITIGQTTGDSNPGGDTNLDRITGFVRTAAASGTVNSIFIRGHDTVSKTVDYRLLIYAVTSYTELGGSSQVTLGNILGFWTGTAITAATDNGGALDTPVSIVSGQKYFLCIHTGHIWRSKVQVGGSPICLADSDTYSNGSPGSGTVIPFTGTQIPVIWATT